jgi:ABC-type oligopeptide transport system substrate-binding subunit
LNGRTGTLVLGIPRQMEDLAPGLGSAIASQVAVLGLDVSVKVLLDEPAKDTVKKLDLLLGKWQSATLDVHSLVHSSGMDNVFGYGDTEVDALIEQMEAAPTWNEEVDAGQSLHTVLAQKRPLLYFWSMDYESVWRGEVHNDYGRIYPSPFDYFQEVDEWQFGSSPREVPSTKSTGNSGKREKAEFKRSGE